ncbi:MAG: TonB-system energizer ExbB [Epsilonproteobacteria bacterium]|nr:TonB-system energizer ExbB [Campylobacterota bacterium]OIO14628.1 MAG: TonB-system energizer ExbB [Helicobacteraceae bacterium CG1_02_36_14]PIP09584.1 MAG: TonB-system energizer ExbB [Sulfurimonas sp. CG23_combo_of_CG06-09_8_20_14_all_36_33]PIS25313.1 MAG: TonB-system energizer ExbB [Sulfurimonas sp. CG08_land_8_20_14_0_20_36_33]PIU33571.1 MAG: TonB-system energizer ExbB [Sulfurimonas sp. CG07_land_8_20_14_0_80_36_56]PIV04040.1 MAG: TonB-system energizer ExbB [Sulfurimonas sp. CG03_land_8_2
MDIELLQDGLDYGVIGILGMMSFITLWFWIERILFYRTLDLSSYKLKESLEIDLTNNISIISSFGSNAPYIGLLGTVFGIIITFYVMGQGGDLDAKNIMTSLALALKATAMGLAVAIPAIFFHTHIVRKMEVLIAKWEILQKEKLEY